MCVKQIRALQLNIEVEERQADRRNEIEPDLDNMAMRLLPSPRVAEARTRVEEVRVGEAIGLEVSQRHFVEQFESVLEWAGVGVAADHGVPVEDVGRIGGGEDKLGLGHCADLCGPAEQEGGEVRVSGEGGGEEEAMDLVELVGSAVA